MLYNFDALSFQILTVDRFFHKKGVFDVKARPYAAFSFRISGTGDFEIANKRLVTNPGDVLFIPANMPYRVEYSSGESIVVHLESCNYCEAENFSFQNVTQIEHRFQRLLESWNEQHSVNRAKSIVYDVLDKIADNKKTSIDDTSFARCVRYMDEHFNEPDLDVEAVCRYGFISVSSLQRAFGEYLGMSPKQYLIKLRMNRALELLSENELSVREVSAACGFADEKYFSRAFKKKYGYAPSQLRNHMIV